MMKRFPVIHANVLGADLAGDVAEVGRRNVLLDLWSS